MLLEITNAQKLQLRAHSFLASQNQATIEQYYFGDTMDKNEVWIFKSDGRFSLIFLRVKNVLMNEAVCPCTVTCSVSTTALRNRDCSSSIRQESSDE